MWEERKEGLSGLVMLCKWAKAGEGLERSHSSVG